MKKTMENVTHIEGILYEHNLESKVSGPNSKTPGTSFISGTISIATDDALTNIVQVHFTYVTPTTAKGSANATYILLQNIIDGLVGTYMKDGPDKAAKLRVDSAIGLNEFYSDRNGKSELVSTKRNEGGFVHLTNTLAEDEKVRNTFKCDMVITGVTHIDGDEEKKLPEKVIVKGAIFDFRKALLPVEFSATTQELWLIMKDLVLLIQSQYLLRFGAVRYLKLLCVRFVKNLLLVKIMFVKYRLLVRTL